MILKTLRRAFYISLAIFFIIIGFAGLVLPILNGIFFLIIGLIILSFEFEQLETILENTTKRHPKIHHWYKKINSFLRKHLGK